MKYCTKCGASIPENSEFCACCGEKVESVNQGVETEIVENNKRYTTDIKERNIVLAIILSFVTCGFYSLYWMVKLNDELLELSNEKGSSGVTVILLSLVTCGIYGIYWHYKMGSCVNKLKGNGSYDIIFLVLSLFGAGIVNYVIEQDTINSIVNN